MKWSEVQGKNHIETLSFEPQSSHSETEANEIAIIAKCCDGVFDNVDQVKKALTRLKKVKESTKSISVINMAETLMKELVEIKDHLKFARHRKGDFAIFAKEYAEIIYDEFQGNEEFNNLLIEFLPEQEELVLTGKVRNQETLDSALSAIEKHPSGVPLQIEVSVASQRADSV